MLKRVIVLGAFVIMTACTPSGPLGPLPVIADEANAATIEIIRVDSFQAGSIVYRFAIDGKEIFGIGSGQHAVFRADLGEHTFALKCIGTFIPGMQEDSMKFFIQKRGESYFKLTPSWRCASIVRITPEEASELKKTSEKIILSSN